VQPNEGPDSNKAKVDDIFRGGDIEKQNNSKNSEKMNLSVQSDHLKAMGKEIWLAK